MADVLCFGDLLIDFVPIESGLSFADLPSFKPAPGGAAANVAVGLGVSSAFMGKVSDDAFGHLLADILEHVGVDVTPIRFEKRARTALAFVTLTAEGERDFLFYRHPSADMLFTPEELDLAAIHAAKIFHFDSISLAAAQSQATALFAADEAAGAGKVISYDINLRLQLWDSEADARSGISEGLRRANIVKLSDGELEFMTGEPLPGNIRSQLWHDGMRLAVLSLGDRGCVAITERSEMIIPSILIRRWIRPAPAMASLPASCPASPRTPKFLTTITHWPNSAVSPTRSVRSPPPHEVRYRHCLQLVRSKQSWLPNRIR